MKYIVIILLLVGCVSKEEYNSVNDALVKATKQRDSLKKLLDMDTIYYSIFDYGQSPGRTNETDTTTPKYLLGFDTTNRKWMPLRWGAVGIDSFQKPKIDTIDILTYGQSPGLGSPEVSDTIIWDAAKSALVPSRKKLKPIQ